MIKRFTLRLTDKQHQTLLSKAKKAGLSANDFLLLQLQQSEAQQTMIDAIISHQNRAFDSILSQLAMLDAAQHASSNVIHEPPTGMLTEQEYRASFSRFLTILSVWFGKQQLDELQHKTNLLTDNLNAGQYKAKG